MNDFRKSKLKSDENEEEPEYKIKKETPSTSTYDSDDSPPSDQQSPIKTEKEDIWYQLETGGQIKDLLPAGIIKNSSKLRFDVKEISLTEDV